MLARGRVGDAEVDEPGFLDAGNDFDRMAECIARPFEECAAPSCLAQGVGADHAHAAGTHVAQALPESFQALQGALHGFAAETALVVETRSKADHLAQPIDDTISCPC